MQKAESTEPTLADDEEDDPGELVEVICDLSMHCDDTAIAKEQLRAALVKLIDQRIAHAARAH